MSRLVKFLIGLVAALLTGWLAHGPIGHGEALVGRLEAEARSAVAATEVPGIEVRLGRDPLTRAATLSGPADPFQREGQGELQGLNDIVAGIDGISTIGWADQGGPGRRLPLLAEAELAVLIAYLLGLGLAKLLFGRRQKESYLD